MDGEKKSTINLFMENRGFTLIEMAIVLIIIGVIIGAVVKGKDVIKSAEQKRLYTTFAREWQVAYNNYYDRTGWILGDDDSNTNTNRDGRAGDGGLASEANLIAQLTAIGLNPPADGPTGLSNVRTYTDAQGRQYTLTLQLDSDINFGNFIRIDSANGIPMDLGMAWDKIVDGTRDGDTGDLRYIPNTGASPLVAADWPNNVNPVATSGVVLLLEF
jgi:prepilin-type N-terminal cleavage/methylation domain-containing protein